VKPMPGNRAEPCLAESYAASADGLSHTFVLRDGVKFQDGRPLTPALVVFTYRYYTQNLFTPLLVGVPPKDDEVTVTGERSVRFRLSQPDATFVQRALGKQPIVPEHIWSKIGDPVAYANPNPVGTGPFTEVELFESTVYELGRNPRYWQPGKPAVDVLRVPLYRSNDEIMRALAADEVDWASLFVPDIEKDWVAKDPARHQYWYPDLGPTVLLYVNTRLAPLDSPGVRKALSMAIDRQAIVDAVQLGDARVAGAVFDRDRALRRGRQPFRWFEPAADAARFAEAFQARAGEDDRVVVAGVELGQARVDVAAQRPHLERREALAQLRLAPQARRADDRARGQMQ